MSKTNAKKKSHFSPKMEYDSPEYLEYRAYLKTRLGSNGLSLCGDHKIAYNPYWKEKHRLDFKQCNIYLPKDWIPDEKFFDVIIKHDMFEGTNTFVRPIEYDEDTSSETPNNDVIFL
jgi:hypothetical protein